MNLILHLVHLINSLFQCEIMRINSSSEKGHVDNIIMFYRINRTYSIKIKYVHVPTLVYNT